MKKPASLVLLAVMTSFLIVIVTKHLQNTNTRLSSDLGLQELKVIVRNEIKRAIDAQEQQNVKHPKNKINIPSGSQGKKRTSKRTTILKKSSAVNVKPTKDKKPSIPRNITPVARRATPKPAQIPSAGATQIPMKVKPDNTKVPMTRVSNPKKNTPIKGSPVVSQTINSKSQKTVVPVNAHIMSGGDSRKSLPGRHRYLVHQCDNTQACSGWGDRQKGLIAAFLLASATNRTFVLNMTSPCNIRKFLQPNHYDWDIPSSTLIGKTSTTIGGVRNISYHTDIQTKDMNKLHPQDVLYYRSNSDLINHIKSNPLYKNKLPKWANTTRPETFRNAWNILMKPTPLIQNQINSVLKGVDLNREGDLVCAHVRIGKNPNLPNDSPNRNSIDSVDVLWEFLDPYVKNASKVFIATDSGEVREMARKRFGRKCLDSGGPILHIDRQRKSQDACDGFETVILEQQILMRCHVLVVSLSNFSIRAAFIRGRKDNLFVFYSGKVEHFPMR